MQLHHPPQAFSMGREKRCVLSWELGTVFILLFPTRQEHCTYQSLSLRATKLNYFKSKGAIQVLCSHK
jgi:hypothetical protein